jgi:hypothetical protein
MIQRNCTYCQREMVRRWAKFGPRIGLRKTRDHVIPQSLGGTKTVPSCSDCNSLKGDMPPEMWKLFMLKNPAWWLLQKNELQKARKRFVSDYRDEIRRKSVRC